MTNTEIANYIRTSRNKLNITQANLAKRCNCGKLAIIRIEKEQIKPGSELLIKILHELNADLSIVSRNTDQII